MKPNIEIDVKDARETFEMLHASHTLLRMAFGACAILNKPESKEDADKFSQPFTEVARIIQETSTNLLSIIESDAMSKSE